MSTMLKITAVLTVAVAAVITSADSADAGCRGGYGYGRVCRYPVRQVYRPVIRHRVVQPAVAAPLPAEPAGPQLTEVPVGSILTLPGNFFGTEPGHVFLVFKSAKLPCVIKDWKPNAVTLALPPMAIKHAQAARLDVVLPHGQLGHEVKILLTPPADIVLHPTAPQSPLPTGIATPGIAAPVVHTPAAP